MPINNLNNSHLTTVQVTAIKESLTDLEEVLATLNISLTPEERRIYGSVNEQNKLFINKVYDFRRESENLSTPDLDWDEFEKDYESRRVLESILNRLTALQERVRNAKILYDYDNYQSALDDYAYTNYKAGSQAAGYETKRNELKQFFARTGKPAPPADQEPTS